jgi:tetratricopeptide (TPR) repeat protein
MAFLKSAKTLMLEGVDHLRKKEYKKALDRFERALKKTPEDVDIINYLAQALLGVGNIEEALKVIEKAIQIDPRNVTNQQLKATFLMMLEMYEEAAPVIDICIALQPGDVAYLMRGQVDYNLQKYYEAELWFDKALEIDPENPLSNQMKGLVLFYQKRFDEAISYLEQSLVEGESESIRKIIETCKVQKVG